MGDFGWPSGPDDAWYPTAEKAKEGIESFIKSNYFPIVIEKFQRLNLSDDWKVVYAPIVVQPKEKPQFGFEWKVDINEDTYREFFQSLDGYKEIFYQRWEDLLGREHINTVWVKNEAITRGSISPKALIIELPYSPAYYHADVALFNAFTDFILGEAISPIIPLPARFSKPLHAISQTWSICKLAYGITKIILKSQNSIAGVYPITNIGELYIDEYTLDHAVAETTFDTEKITAEIHLDYIKSGSRDEIPWQDLDHLTLDSYK